MQFGNELLSATGDGAPFSQEYIILHFPQKLKIYTDTTKDILVSILSSLGSVSSVLYNVADSVSKIVLDDVLIWYQLNISTPAMALLSSRLVG